MPNSHGSVLAAMYESAGRKHAPHVEEDDSDAEAVGDAARILKEISESLPRSVVPHAGATLSGGRRILNHGRDSVVETSEAEVYVRRGASNVGQQIEYVDGERNNGLRKPALVEMNSRCAYQVIFQDSIPFQHVLFAIYIFLCTCM